MIICVPITPDGNVDPRWGRADWIAIADVVGGEILSWREIEVSWNTLHDEGTDGSHHARVVRFLKDEKIEAVVANHMGDGMTRMLETMKLPVHLGAAGNARAAIQALTPSLVKDWQPSKKRIKIEGGETSTEILIEMRAQED